MSDVLYVISGLLLGLAFQGGLWLFSIPFAVVAFVLGWLNRPSLPPASSVSGAVPVLRATRTTDATAVGRILRPVPQTGAVSIVRDVFEAYPGAGDSALEKLKGREIWDKMERDLDPVYRSSLQSIQSLIPGARSVLLFFKTGDGKAFALRQFASSAEEEIDLMATIPENSGLIGQLARPDILRILEGDLPNGKGLGYYKTISPVHSVVGVPMINSKKQRVGALVVDSLEFKAFPPSIVPILTNFCSTYYLLTYKSFASAQNFREKKKFHELSNYQQNFFTTMPLRDTYKQIFEYVSANFLSDRLMILAFENPERGEGSVALCYGEDSEALQGFKFSVDDKGILPLAMMQHGSSERVFSGRPAEYVLRINDNEPRNLSLRYLFVQSNSMTTDDMAENRPAEIAICLERKNPIKFDQFEKDLLKFLVNIAYFAYQRGRQFEKEQNLAGRDGLTGLMNRHSLDEELKKLDFIHREKNVGVMMMDIDHFKYINDTYGHPAGDDVIRGIANRIVSVAQGEHNVIARYGGEEFVVALPGVSEEVLLEKAERIREAIGTLSFDIHRPERIPVTVSIGCYLVTPDFKGEMSRTVSYADQALYSAKEGGRNRVVEYKKTGTDQQPITPIQCS